MENKIINFNLGESKTQIFENSEFGALSIMMIEGKEYFHATECAKILGYANPRKAIGDHCKGVTKRDALTSGGKQVISFIPESDLYRLIIKSKLPSAERFEKWVFEEVLPSIRKHGLYAKDELLDNPDLMISIITALKQEREEKKRLQAENQILLPKGEYYDQLVDREVNINLRSTAKELCVKEKDLIGYLTAKKYLFRDSKNRLMPYAQYVDKYFVLKEYVNNNHGGVQTLVSVAGREFLLNKIDDIKAFSAA